MLKNILISNRVRAVIWGVVLLVGLIALPTYMLAKYPMFDNPLTRVLFDVLLLIASLLVGVTFSNQEMEKKAAGRWLPAAEMVCNELLTMSATTERMCRKQSQVNDSLKKHFPETPEATLGPIGEFVDHRCGYCSENLENLKNHIENNYRNWDILIRSNGEKQEVQEIHDRLEKRRGSLFKAIERDFPS